MTLVLDHRGGGNTADKNKQSGETCDSTDIALPITFDCANITYKFTKFDGGEAYVISNPKSSGINTSVNVAEAIKYAEGDGKTWGGAFISLTDNIDFNKGTVFTMQVWASREVPVLFKLEGSVDADNANGADNAVEATATHSGDSSWQKLTFAIPSNKIGTFADDPAKKITIIFDNGTIGQHATNKDNWTFYFDTITQTTPDPDSGSSALSLPITFEKGDVNYAADGSGYTISVEDNPKNSGINTSTKAAKITKNGSDWDNISWTFAEPIAFNATTANALKAKIYSPNIGTQFKLKVENADASAVAEIDLTTTESDTWQEFEAIVNFNAEVDYTKLFVFIDGGKQDTNNLVVYIDDIALSYKASSDDTPTDAPADPTADANSVTSLFSDAYTDIPSNLNPGWSEVSTSETIANNTVRKVTNFQPFQLNAATDISAHTHMHVDVWLPALPSAGAGLLIKILGSAPNESTVTEPMANLTAGQWNSIDIPLSSLNGSADLTIVDQVLVDIVDDATMYVDNVYFYTQ